MGMTTLLTLSAMFGSVRYFSLTIFGIIEMKWLYFDKLELNTHMLKYTLHLISGAVYQRYHDFKSTNRKCSACKQYHFL